MVSVLALALWLVASAVFLGGSLLLGLGIGALAFAASGWAMKRPGDLESMWAAVFTLVIAVSAIRGGIWLFG